jgi:hypothetical protein
VSLVGATRAGFAPDLTPASYPVAAATQLNCLSLGPGACGGRKSCLFRERQADRL